MSKMLKTTVIFMALLLAFLVLPMMALQASPLPQPVAVSPETSLLAPNAVVTITILHTNDFHGYLDPTTSDPGMARTARVINDVRAAVGAANVALFDAGDEMQGTLLSNYFKGASTIDIFNALGYNAATIGNHEFDWGQTTLLSRTQQAAYPFVAANLVSGSCAAGNWTLPAFVDSPWITQTVGAPGNQIVLGIIGVSSQETPYITKAENVTGLCFKDPAQSIIHYYNDVKAASDVVIVLSHIGYTDVGYGYGSFIYGDQTLAKKLVEAGTPVPLIIGGHTHTNLTSATNVSNTLVVQAYRYGRAVGQATLVFDTNTHAITGLTWQKLAVSNSGAEDAAIKSQIATWSSDPGYQILVNQIVGYTNIGLTRNDNGDSTMSAFINDAIYNDLNTDAEPSNDVDMAFNNAGGLRADITSTVGYPYTLTYSTLYSVLPFGNATIVGEMTGAQIMELLNQSATLFKGSLQVSGIRFSYYAYTDTLAGPQPWAWGAYSITVKSRTTPGLWEPLVMTKTYHIATNDFLAPLGQDGFLPFQYIKNYAGWGDMLDSVNRWVSKTYSTTASAYNVPLDGRVVRNGGNTYTGAPTEVVPVTVLHHNDSHGNLVKTQYVGYTQLATLIKQERLHNPNRTLLLSSGDNIQGDPMMYYFKSAPTGFAADGTPLPPSMTTHPLIAAFNAMNYTAYTLGNHEFNFGKDVFASVLKQANFPVLQANLYDNGSYGLNQVPVKTDVTSYLPGPAGTIKVAVLGIGNHRVPNYELPSNIPGLTFTNPISETQGRAPALKAGHDAVIALTHIGFTANPKSVEVDNNVDTVLAAQTTGVDAIIGGHSHTDPSKQTDASGDYKWLPAFVGSANNTPVIINQAYRYNSYLGEVVLGLLPKAGGGYDVVARAGRDQSVPLSTPEDPTILAIVAPYSTTLKAYNDTPAGYTAAPIDTTNAYTAETNAANLQADASVAELQSHGINPDFHLSGAMTRPSSTSNWVMFKTATPTTPTQMLIGDMFTLMPYENSLVALRMNGPQLKAVLERAYRNYWYYKYQANANPPYGGYSWYTTCMLDTNHGNQIRYRDTYPLYPNGNNVSALLINGQPIDFLNATKYYTVSTVNYLAAGSCNFNNNGVSLWPLDPASIVADTQYYVRDAVIHYTTAQGTVTPTIEGRLQFTALNKMVFLPLIMK
jgi:2',3'-cyclic-nucleotide 2'-phosphodiesterase (5'-nucleotidase family)